MRSTDERPLRILHVIVHLSAGGAELMMKRLILAQHRMGPFEHSVVSLRGMGSIGPELVDAGIKVEALGINSAAALPRAFARLVRLMRERKADVVQTWMYHADFLGGLAARLAGVRAVVWNVRVARIGPQYGVARTTMLIARACAMLSAVVPSRIIYVAESARKSHEDAGYDRTRSHTIANGYQIPVRRGEADRLERRARMGAGPDTLLVASAGRFNRQKNHGSFVRACGSLAKAFPEARFVLFGSGLDPGNAELAGWIEATGHSGRFALMGEQRDLTDWLAACDLFCLHSLTEGFPNVVAEAMSVAVPCVVTDAGDAAALVDDTGWVVPVDDDAALVNALSGGLRLDNHERSNYGERARKRIESHYAMPAVAEQYARVYRALAGPRVIGEHV